MAKNICAKFGQNPTETKKDIFIIRMMNYKNAYRCKRRDNSKAIDLTLTN